MNPAPISPGWALVAIFLLWGLAGALDQPVDRCQVGNDQVEVDVE